MSFRGRLTGLFVGAVSGVGLHLYTSQQLSLASQHLIQQIEPQKPPQQFDYFNNEIIPVKSIETEKIMSAT